MKYIWNVLAVVLLSAFFSLCLVGYGTHMLIGDMGGALKLVRTKHLLERYYYGETSSHKLLEGAIRGMVEAVDDPYTSYLDSKDFQRLTDMTHGSFSGIGVVFGKRNNQYEIISVLEDNPGAKAGIKEGDIIVGVNGESTAKMSMDAVSNNIRGPIDTEVVLELKNKKGELRKVTVIRKEIKTISIAGKMLDNGNIGYIRIANFSENTGAEFTKKYHELEEKGMQALVLDLRSNPGGLLSSGVEVAQLLVPKGPIVSVVNKAGQKQVEYSELEKVKYPLAILVNGGTASAAEIVSGAVKDTKSGKLFGEKTFGKGCVQHVYRLSSADAVKITVADYYTPSGASIHKKGIEPDVEVKLPEHPTEDVQLKAAVQYLKDELQKKEK